MDYDDIVTVRKNIKSSRCVDVTDQEVCLYLAYTCSRLRRVYSAACGSTLTLRMFFSYGTDCPRVRDHVRQRLHQ